MTSNFLLASMQGMISQLTVDNLNSFRASFSSKRHTDVSLRNVRNATVQNESLDLRVQSIDRWDIWSYLGKIKFSEKEKDSEEDEEDLDSEPDLENPASLHSTRFWRPRGKLNIVTSVHSLLPDLSDYYL